MERCAVFLRGMNVGGHRITNDELCSILGDLGMQNPEAFLASGNVAFDAPRGKPDGIAAQLEQGLHDALGYEVPLFVRTADEVRAIAAQDPFGAEQDAFAGKLQVSLLRSEPTADVTERVLDLATKDDLLAIVGRELYWLPRGRLTDSALDHKGIERALGMMTTRTHRTVTRIVEKYFIV